MYRKELLSGVAAIAMIVGMDGSVQAQAVKGDLWTGLYVGGVLGLVGADFKGRHQSAPSAASAPNLNGFGGGLLGGYNHQINSYVVGFEADILWSGKKKFSTTASAGAGGIREEVDLLASIRGRLGYLPQDDLLVYATAGVGFIDATHSIRSSGLTTSRFSLDDVGFVIGGGVEWRPENSFYSFRLQGLYYLFNEKKNTFAAGIGSAAVGDFGEIKDAYSLTAGVTFDLSRLFGSLPDAEP